MRKFYFVDALVRERIDTSLGLPSCRWAADHAAIRYHSLDLQLHFLPNSDTKDKTLTDTPKQPGK